MKLEDIFKNEHSKRALEVALTGNHSIQFIGSWTSQAGALTRWAREHGLRARMVAPCPCGFFGDPARECTCSMTMISKWQRQKFSPRVQWDITIETPTSNYADEIIAWLKGRRGEPEEAMLKRVEDATDDVDIDLDATNVSLLKAAIMQLYLSFDQVRAVMSIARSIARLAHTGRLHTAHLAEAIQYRPRRHPCDR